MKRKFRVDFGMTEAIIEIDQVVIDAVTDEWRSMFYDLHTAEEIGNHIAYNLIVNGYKLSDLDGWADQLDSNARVISHPDFDIFDCNEIGDGETS